MSKLLILGNGFNLNLGLKTSYEDFFNYYINKNKNFSQFEIFNRLKKYVFSVVVNRNSYIGDYDVENIKLVFAYVNYNRNIYDVC